MKIENPLVSVLVPCYNHEEYIEECILSIINQTYKNIEIIVVDDGSKDNSSAILERLALEHCFYFEKQQNMGVSKTLNKCLSYSKSDLIVTISSDDMLMPNAIEDFINIYRKLGMQFSLIFGDSLLIDENSKDIEINKFRNVVQDADDIAFSTFLDYFKYIRNDLLNSKYLGTYGSLLIGNYISVGMMYNKRVLQDIGAWNETLKLEDHELWLRMSKVQKFEYTHSIVSKYRFHETNTRNVDSEKLLMNSIEMLLNEKQYIQKENVKKEWFEAYNTALLGFIKIKKLKNFIKYYNFESSISYFIFKKFYFNFIKR